MKYLETVILLWGYEDKIIAAAKRKEEVKKLTLPVRHGIEKGYYYSFLTPDHRSSHV